MIRLKKLNNTYRSCCDYLSKIKNYAKNYTIASIAPSLFLSALFHLLIIILLIGIFATKNSAIIPHSQISPVAVISGEEFKSLQSAFTNRQVKKKPIIADKTNKIVKQKIKLVQNNQNNQEIGNKNSNRKKGLNLNLPVSSNPNYSNSYLNIIANQLEKYKSYITMESAPQNVMDKVLLKVKLTKNGNISSYKIIQYSNYSFFDKAAKKILELSSPFPKPPLELKHSLEFIVPIIFDTI